jgi:hypothetical protein
MACECIIQLRESYNLRDDDEALNDPKWLQQNVVEKPNCNFCAMLQKP